MIVTVVRPRDSALLLVSIPRDTRVAIPGRETAPTRLRTPTPTAAPGWRSRRLSEFLDLRDRSLCVDQFPGFPRVIDTIGGIKLPIEKDLVNDDPDHEHFVVKAGQPFYNGEDALNYVRFREDAGGDASRTKRQQIFLQAIIDKASEVGEWRKIPELIEIMGSNFATDIPPDDLLGLAEQMLRSKTRTIYSHTLEGRGPDGGRRLVLHCGRARCGAGEIVDPRLAGCRCGLQSLPKPEQAGTAGR